MKHLKTPQELNEDKENLNISDVRQRFIQMVEDRIKSLEREMEYTKQGKEFYDKLSENFETEQNRLIVEEFEKIKNLMNYSKKTQ